MSETEEIPQALAIAWGLLEEPTRGPSRALTHERIVRAACEIADSEGLAAVTMKSVAASLGFTTMSLYRYVTSKDVLLQLMIDSLLDPEALSEIEGVDWRGGLKEWAQYLRDFYRSHPWALEIPRGQISVMMPGSMALADTALSLMKPLDMRDEDAVDMILALTGLITYAVSLEVDLERQEDGMLSLGALGQLRDAVDVDRFPHMGPLMFGGDYVGSEAEDEEYDFGFEFSLDRMLDGLAAYGRRESGPAS